ncbi:MAG: ester cyclase [Nocardioidaceae bacterium]
MPAAQTARNKATFAVLHDALNSGDPELISRTIDRVFDPDVRIGTPLPVDATGAQELKQVWAILLRAYPDLHVTVEELIAEGDKLVVRNTVTGTHQGEYLGVAATGRPVTYGEVLILRFADGRIAETSGVVDLLAQLKQLGLIPGLATSRPHPSES